MSASGEASSDSQQSRRPPGRREDNPIGCSHLRLLWSNGNRGGSRVAKRKELPTARYSFELVGAAGVEREARADNEVFDSSRHEHFAGACQRADARADVDGESGEVVLDTLALAGV